MEKVNANWPRLIATWAVLSLVGLWSRFGISADWAHGVEPALILVGAINLRIDVFADRRASSASLHFGARKAFRLSVEHGAHEFPEPTLGSGSAQ